MTVIASKNRRVPIEIVYTMMVYAPTDFLKKPTVRSHEGGRLYCDDHRPCTDNWCRDRHTTLSLFLEVESISPSHFLFYFRNHDVVSGAITWEA